MNRSLGTRPVFGGPLFVYCGKPARWSAAQAGEGNDLGFKSTVIASAMSAHCELLGLLVDTLMGVELCVCLRTAALCELNELPLQWCLRTVMVVDNIIITAAGRVVLRTTERPAGFAWGLLICGDQQIAKLEATEGSS